MSDLFADAMRRHAHARPGHTLLAAEACAIPASALTLDVLAEVAEDLEASCKYALRAMLHGIDTVDDLQLFLGLDQGDTGRAVAALLDAEYISYQPPAEGGVRRLQLLPAGREAARDAQVRRPKPVSIPLVYDRLAGAVTSWRKNSLRRSSQAKADAGRILLQPASSMPLRPTELSAAAVTSALDERIRDRFRILGVSGVTENRNYYYDAVLLIFKDLDSDVLRLGIEVDGALSEPHAARLEDMNAAARLGLSIVPAEFRYEPVAGSGDRLNRDEVMAIQAAAADAGPSESDGALGRAAIRWLGAYEHPQFLENAVSNSRHRLLISSSTIRRTIVSDAWIKRVEALAQTVDVTIVWGSRNFAETDQEAVNALNAAARRARRLAIVKVNDIGARVLISDGRYVKTSFDWLSFRGGPARSYRQDEGDLVQDQALANRAYDDCMIDWCARAADVVGTLPQKFHTGVGTAQPAQPAKPALSAPPRDRRQRANSGEERRAAALRGLAVGQVISGPVKRLTDFGAFVGLGEVDGLIHISQLANYRVSHPSEVVSVGEMVTVKILDVDVSRKRVSLSLKAVSGNSPIH